MGSVKNFKKEFLLLIMAGMLLLFGCRKDQTVQIQDKVDVTTFYANTETLNPTLLGLINSFKKDDHFNAQLGNFITKNGVPVWKETIYKTGGMTTVAKADVRMNSTSTRLNTASPQDTSKGVFLIPLQSQTDESIKSYIVATKYNDSNYSYRLYNRDSLDRIRPTNDTVRQNLTNVEAVFGVFEKNINNKNTILISGTVIRNARMEYNISSQVSQSSKPRVNYDYCVINITMTLYYEQIMYSYMYGPPEYQLVAVVLDMQIDCYGGGGSGGVQGLDPGPGGNGGSGYNWWQFGTGWPWNDPYQYGYYNDPWQTWWTTAQNIGSGGGAGSGSNQINDEFNPYASDFDPEVDWWDDQNTTYPPQPLPTYNNFVANYPTTNGHDMPAGDVYRLVGGMPLSIYMSDSIKNGNACALRVSRALNYSGVTIPNIPNKTFLGSDGKYYFLSAAAIGDWMNKTFGTSGPNVITVTKAQGGTNGQNFDSYLQGNQGIYSLRASSNSKFGATGHATYYNGTNCPIDAKGLHTTEYYNADGGVEYIRLWKLP